MAGHPHVAAVMRTPFMYLILLAVGWVSLRAERQLKLPNIVAKFVNSRLVPDLSTTTMKTVFDSQAKKSGWDEETIDWDWFIEVQLANDSDTPATIEKVEARAIAGGRSVPVTHSEDFLKYSMDYGLDGQGNSIQTSFVGQARYRPVPNLMKKIRGVPLTKGIGYRGWLRFKMPKVSQRDVNEKRIKMDIWLVDALEGRHKLYYKRNSDREWDNAFFIFHE